MKSLALFALSVSAASAIAFPVVYQSSAAGSSVGVEFFGNHRNVFAGKLRFKDATTNATFLTVCADLANTISGGQAYSVDPSNTNSAAAGISAAGNIVSAHFASANSNDDATALQLAVWEAIYDYNGSTAPAFAGGNFGAAASAGILAKAAQYYASVATPGNATYLKANPSNSGQSQLTAVPEPAALAGLGIAGLMFILRRKK